MNDDRKSAGLASRRLSHHLLRGLAIAASVVVMLLLAVVVLLAFRWPFRQKDVIQDLERRLPGTVVVKDFSGLYFPHPGCVMRGLTVTRSPHDSATPPLATASKLTIKASYLDLFLRPDYIRLIRIDDLAVEIGPRGSQPQSASGGSRRVMRVGSIVVQNARLIIARANGKKPLDFAIHSLVLNSVARDRQFSYSVEMTNALPPGELSAHGNFGPWNSQNFKETPVSGSYVFERANLAVFPSISGSLSSQDEFSGVLENIAVGGWVDIPDFHVKSASHTVHVHAPFRAIVNGTNGDVQLEDLKPQIGETTIHAAGSIAGHAGRPGKITTLDLSVENGRIEDVLDLFVGSPQPPLAGATTFQAHTTIETFGRGFLRKTALNGTFAIKDAKFTSQHTELSVASLSARSLGEKEDAPIATDVRLELRGRIDMNNGKAHFTNLSMSIPGAAAQIHGAYNLLNQRIDFHGTLKTQAEISKTTSGIKSVLLKPFDPLFKKKNAGAVIPIEMAGTYDHPHFGIDLAAKHARHPSGHH